MFASGLAFPVAITGGVGGLASGSWGFALTLSISVRLSLSIENSGSKILPQIFLRARLIMEWMCGPAEAVWTQRGTT